MSTDDRPFYEDAEHIAPMLDAMGFPLDKDTFERDAQRTYDALVKFARQLGCNCTFTLHIVNPFPEFYGMKLVHEDTCIGLMRATYGDD